VAEELDAGTLAFAQQVFDLAREGATGQLVDYLEHGLPVNLTNGKGDTLLLLAAYYDRPDTVAALVAHGADVARVNDRGQTALAAAVFRQSERTVRLLLDAGADPAGGAPSALQTAEFFDLPDMLALLRRPPA
jgi:ankyrin repeat protein